MRLNCGAVKLVADAHFRSFPGQGIWTLSHHGICASLTSMALDGFL